MTAEEIKKLRKDLKMTQQEFADTVRVTRVTVNIWENNKAQPLPIAEYRMAELRMKLEVNNESWKRL